MINAIFVTLNEVAHSNKRDPFQHSETDRALCAAKLPISVQPDRLAKCFSHSSVGGTVRPSALAAFEIDRQLELDRELDGKIAWLAAIASAVAANLLQIAAGREPANSEDRNVRSPP